MKKLAKLVSRVVTAIYVRVSTDDQAQEGFSIRAQIEKLKTYAQIKGWDIYDIYSDEGISGKNIVDRPEMNRLIDDVNDGKVNNVLVFKIDRLTRSTKNLIELVELFEENNCAFNSLTESVDTDTPSGRMFLKIIGIFAEFERENLSTRLKLGFERKVKEGFTLANNIISYGYIKDVGQKIQTIHPDEAKIVKDIFAMYVEQNTSMNKIARTLNERKIPTKRNARMWDAGTIRTLLANPTYIGKVRYSTMDKDKYFEVDGQHEPILTDEVFALAQEKTKNIPQYSRTKRPKEENYFCGVLVCASCGGKFTTHNQTYKRKKDGATVNNSSYRCNNRQYSNPEISCQAPIVTHVRMEKAFSEYIQNINDFIVDDVELNDDTIKKERELLEYIADCEKRLKALSDKKKKVMEQFVNEEMTFDEYRDILGVMNEKFDSLDGELIRARADITTTQDVPHISREDIITNLQENWDNLNNNERMMFLQRFVKRLVVRMEKKEWRFNFATVEHIEFNNVMALDEPNRKTVKEVWNHMGR